MTAPAVTTVASLEAEVAAELGSRLEARWLIEEAWWKATGSGPPDRRAGVLPGVAEAVAAMVRRRRNFEPLQYVFGHWPFRRLDLEVDRRVLIPRPETEALVDIVAEILDDVAGGVVVDLGTGSGALALAMADELGSKVAEVVATDLEPGALEVARSNHRRLTDHRRREGALEPVPVRFLRGSWWKALPEDLSGHLAAVVANPPYVAEAEWPSLDPSVRLFEPRAALVAGPGPQGTPGLADVATVLVGAPKFLGRPGAVVVELAPHQAEAASVLAAASGFERVEIRADLAGRPRVLVAQYAG